MSTDPRSACGPMRVLQHLGSAAKPADVLDRGCLCPAPGLRDSGNNPCQRAHLNFSAPSSNRPASVACRGERMRDRARIDALWNPHAQAWFAVFSDAPQPAAGAQPKGDDPSNAAPSDGTPR